MNQRRITVLIACGLALALSLTGPARAADNYEVDSAHSMLVFKVDHMGYSFSYGRFNDISGSFSIDEANPANSSVTMTVQAGSIDTNSEQRDRHLKGPDFLNAGQFPEIRFRSKKVEKSGDDYKVSGDFTLRGITKPLTVNLTRRKTGADPWGNHRTGFNASFTIRRTDFGVNYNPQAIGDEVELMVAIEGIRSSPGGG